MSDKNADKLAKDIANGRIAKWYQQHNIDMAPTSKGHVLQAARDELTKLKIEAALGELEQVLKNVPMPSLSYDQVQTRIKELKTLLEKFNG